MINLACFALVVEFNAIYHVFMFVGSMEGVHDIGLGEKGM